MRSSILQDSLTQAVSLVDIDIINNELSALADKHALQRMASLGLRGELVFAVPSILRARPALIGYYRLLLGFSQKQFYNKQHGLLAFKSLESKATIRPALLPLLEELCRCVNASASVLVSALDDTELSPAVLDDLSLLTLGPQLRGGSNVSKGILGIASVFALIREVVSPYLVEEDSKRLAIRSASGRIVHIAFAPDPDIVIQETLGNRSIRHLVAIEVKAGTDYSNIHNRIGEAEKSHRKAASRGFTERWTIVNVEAKEADLRKESPSTDRFYNIANLQAKSSGEYEDFRQRIISLCGLPS